MEQSVLLDELIVVFDGDLKPYEQALREVESKMGSTLRKLQEQWGEAWDGLTASTKKVKAEDVFPRPPSGLINELNTVARLTNQLRQQFNTASIDGAEYESRLASLNARYRQLASQAGTTDREVLAVTNAFMAQEKASRQLVDTSGAIPPALDQVRNLAQTLRHEVENEVLTRGEAIRQLEAYRSRILEVAGALDRNTTEYRQMQASAATASRTIATMEGELTKLGLSGNVAVAVTAALNKEVKSTSEQMRELQSVVTPLSSTLGGGGLIGLLMGGAGAFGAASLAGTGIAGALHLETFAAQLEVVTANAAEARRVFQELDQVTATAPFGFQQLSKATTQLLTFGESADTVISTLLGLSDVAITVGMGVDELADIYGRLRVQGTVANQDINQLQRRGIPIVQELADVLGVAEHEVRDLVKAGAVGFPEMEKAFQNLTAEGGRFEGMAQRMSSTTAGRIRTLRDEFSRLTDNVGKALLPALNRGITGAQRMTDAFNRLTDEQQQTIVRIGGVATAMMTASGIAIALSANIGRITAAFNALRVAMLGNPFGWVALAVGAVAGLAASALLARQRFESLEDVTLRAETAQLKFANSANDSRGAVLNLMEATDENGLTGAVTRMASLLEGDASDAFVQYARQAIATGEDIQQVTADIVQNFLIWKEKLLAADVETYTRRLAESQKRLEREGGFTIRVDDTFSEMQTRLMSRYEQLREQLSAAEERAARGMRGAADEVTNLQHALNETTESLQALDANWFDTDNLDPLRALQAEVDFAEAALESLRSELNLTREAMLNPEEYARQFEPSVVERQGRETGEAFGDGFDKGWRDSPALKAIERLTGELGAYFEAGMATPVQVVATLTPLLKEFTEQRDALLTGGQYGTDEWNILAEQLRLINRLLDTARAKLPTLRPPRPDEGEGTGRTYTDLTPQWLRDIADAVTELEREFSADIAFRMNTLGESVNYTASRVEFLQRTLRYLHDEGAAGTELYVKYTWELRQLQRMTSRTQTAFDGFTGVMKDYQSVVADVNRALAETEDPLVTLLGRITELQQRVPALGFLLRDLAERVQFKIDSNAAEELDNLEEAARARVAALTGTPLDPFETEIAALRKLAEENENAREWVHELIAELKAAQAEQAFNTAVENAAGSLREFVTGLRGSINELQAVRAAADNLMGRAPTQLEAFRVSLDALARAGGIWAVQAAVIRRELDEWETERAATALDELRDRIRGIGQETSVFDDLREDVHRMGTEFEWTTEQVEELLGWIRIMELAADNNALVEKQQEASAAVTQFSRRVQDMLPRAGSDFTSLREEAAELTEELLDVGLSAEELHAVLLLIDELETIHTLRDLSTSVGGVGGALLGAAADAYEAWQAFQRGGSTLELVAAGFGAATDSVNALQDAFKDGFDGNQAFSALTGLAAGIGTILGGPMMGQAIGAVGGFLQSILGDMSNGLRAIQEQVSSTVAGSRYLGDELVKGIASANTKQVSRGGFLGLLGLKKSQLNKEGYAAAVQLAEGIAGGLAGAFSARNLGDFREAFAGGLENTIREEIVRGFMLTDEVQNAVKRIMALINSGDYVGAQAAWDALEASAEATWRRLDGFMRSSAKTADELERAARAIRDVERATAGILQGVATNQLERAFAAGAVSLREYETALNRLAAGRALTQFEADIDRLNAAIREAELDENFGLVAALREQKDAVAVAYRDALEQGAYDAANTIKEILGTTVEAVGSSFRSAFDAADVQDFNNDWGRSLLLTTREALITAFMNSELMKPLLSNLSDAITDAVAGGNLTPDALTNIIRLGEQAGENAERFFTVLEQLGLDLGSLSEQVNSVTASMSNVPTVWKGVLAEWNASDVRMGNGNYSGNEVRHILEGLPVGDPVMLNIHFEGPVYGMDDFEDKVVATVRRADSHVMLARSGR